jgi:transcriptional regulator with XRE-family HTH domain
VPRSLDVTKLDDALAAHGLSQTTLAKEIGVSRAAVSKWFRGESFPRPDKLLKIALAVSMPYEELVSEIVPNEPIVAFRKKGARKTTEAHVARAKDMGRMLTRLVPHLPGEPLTDPPALREPNFDYEYLQSVARDVREKIGIAEDTPLEFSDLIEHFERFSVVLIPVFWGDRKAHENALHIHLPESGTTWIYLNLDSQTHDFKFWMAHELGHVISPSLEGDEAEDFADEFAAAILFPEACAAAEYETLARKANPGSIINHLKDVAERFMISPITVFEQVRQYARAAHQPALALDRKAIFPATTKFNQQFYTVRETLFDREEPTASSYIRKSEEIFDTPFFKVLSEYLRDAEAGASYVQAVLNTSIVDAKAITAELG